MNLIVMHCDSQTILSHESANAIAIIANPVEK